MLTVEQARKAVRRSDNTYDDELSDLIDAGRMDLETAGVVEPPAGKTKLFDHALRMYVRAHFDTSDPDAPRCLEIYKDLKGTMKLTDRYRGELTTE